ncbi:MAG: sulfite oxidase, partial [Caulobacterales bacterium]|nr:sulfite oxidase [Caulobacterales bacterium]
AGGAGLAAALGMPVPFARNLPPGFAPAALAQSLIGDDFGKPGLTVLNDRPVNMETPPHLLDDEITPADRMFVRNNGVPPILDGEDLAGWRLVIDGEVERRLELSLTDLKTRFETVSLRLVLECAGNGRRFFEPGATGNQWTFGAVGCPRWTGVRLRDVLREAGVKPRAVYTAHYGRDTHLSGDPDKHPISRGVPMEKALEPHTLIAWALNGADMPLLNGHPLRLVAPGWPASCSQKWLTRITLRDQVHDGAKMTGQSYRVPGYPVAPGADVPDEDMVIIHSMPVKSLITFPSTGARARPGAPLEVRGHAWAGDLDVAGLDVSLDFGATWSAAILHEPANRFAWQRWRAQITLPEAGYYEVWARARDREGRVQPPIPPGWNPRGYLNNMQHRIAVFAV